MPGSWGPEGRVGSPPSSLAVFLGLSPEGLVKQGNQAELAFPEI